MSRRPFLDFVAAQFPTPEAAAAAFFDDMVAAATTVGAQLDAMPTFDGRRHYLPNLAGKKDQKQFYLASIESDADGTAWPCITFKRFKGDAVYWKPRDLAFKEFQAGRLHPVPANDNARQDYRAAAAAAIAAAAALAAQAERIKAEGQAAAAAAAITAWEAAEACSAHAYLASKAVPSHGLRVARRDLRARLWNDDASEWQEALAVRAGDLLISMSDEAGQLVNLQRIDATGRKRFIMGGRAHGCHFRIGGTGRTTLAEGYATGATWHAATGDSVVLAFSAGALPAVAAYIAADGVAADNDNSAAGEKYAKATGLRYLMPPIAGDWNDYAALVGLDGVRAAIANDNAKAPFVSLEALPTVELKGREDQWLNGLAKCANQADAMATAWTIMRRLFAAVPGRFDLAGLTALVQDHAPACGLPPDFIAAAVDRLGRRLHMRRKQALAGVSFSPEAVARHRYQRRTSLPTLTADDYQGVILVRAPKAMGKTKTILKPFADWAYNAGQCFVAVVHRVSLVRELARVLGCDIYTDVDREWAPTVRTFATCLPSIVRNAHQPIIQNCDYLAVDEIAQTLAFIESETACKSEGVSNAGVYAALRALVSRARCIIGADAGLNDQVIAFLESCRPGEQFRIIDVADADQGLTAAFGWGDDGLAAALGEMQHRLREGENIWVSCDTRRMAEAVAAWMRETTKRPVLCITKAKTAERERFLADAQEVSREYAAVIHSPAISSGISIEHDHFSHGFLIYSGCTIGPQDASQMLRRCRQLRTWTLALSANKRRGMTDPDAMLAAMEAAERLAGTVKRATDFDAFIADIRTHQEQARADGSAGLLWQLEQERFAVIPLTATPDAAALEGCRLARQALRDQERRAILAARDLTEDEAHTLRRKGQQTADEEAALARHVIAKGLGVPSVDAAALEAWERIGPKTMDRFAAAFMGYTGRAEDHADHLTHRTPHKARMAAYSRLFAGLDVREGLEITDALANTVLDRMIADRFALAWLGIAQETTFGAVLTDKDGNVMPFKRPAYPRRVVCDLFRRLGLAIREGKSKGKERYFLPDDFGHVRTWAERRTGGRLGHISKQIPAISPPRTPADDAYWLDVRRAMWANADALTKEAAAAEFFARLEGREHTYGVYMTAFWMKNCLSEKIAA